MLDWLVARARRNKARVGVYIALIAGFWTTLVAIPKAIDPFLPSFPKDREWLRNLLAVMVGLGVPTVVILLTEGLPTWLRKRRERRLIDWGVQGQAEYGYFRLTPYERKDRERYRRADQRTSRSCGGSARPSRGSCT